MRKVSDRDIRRAANKATGIYNLCHEAGYLGNPSSDTLRRVGRIIGPQVYAELRSGIRDVIPRSRWTKVPVNTR